MRTLAFIDASNLFYGGEKSLGWKIDYQKLLVYLQKKYEVNKILYFGGVETHGFEYNYQTKETVPLEELKAYLLDMIQNQDKEFNEAQLLLIGRHLQDVIVLSRGARTAKEIRQFAGNNFRDFEYLKNLLRMQ